MIPTAKPESFESEEQTYEQDPLNYQKQGGSSHHLQKERKTDITKNHQQPPVHQLENITALTQVRRNVPILRPVSDIKCPNKWFLPNFVSSTFYH